MKAQVPPKGALISLILSVVNFLYEVFALDSQGERTAQPLTREPNPPPLQPPPPASNPNPT